MKRFEEIQQLILAGKSDRFISRAVGCRRSKISRIRSGVDQIKDVGKPIETTAPLWVEQVDWETVLLEVGQGYQLKRIWEEKSADLTTYPNFCKQLHNLKKEEK